MSNVVIVHDGDADWQKSFVDWKTQAGPTKEGLLYKSILRMEPGMPNMQRVRFDPNYVEPLHSHPDDEVITVVAGAIHFGRDVLAAGDTIYVGHGTRYSLRAGDAGAEFIRIGMPLEGPGYE
jgi:quercetin dioxygenase-like cupin family protein